MNSATYSPEDNKLRLYVGRVPREEYLKLRAEGWTALHKQREAGGGDFVAIWTPARRDTALEYGGGVILDEDMGPEERAADRAERFSGYRDKRTSEAVGHADRYDAGPSAHGYQSEARAERAAARHDRIADRAVDAWSKAEYWTSRTAGVIGHALHLSSPGVRMGRIKTIEADLRRWEKTLSDYRALYSDMQKIAAIVDPVKQTEQALHYCGSRSMWGEYMHPRAAEHPKEYRRTNATSLYSLLSDEVLPITGAEACALFFANNGAPKLENDWTTHYKLRLAYENQMCEAAGGRAALVEMVPGGFVGSHQILKVNKSSVTGQVVSVSVMATYDTWDGGNRKKVTGPVLFNIERLKADAYRAPTVEELAAFEAARKAEKENAPKKAACPLVNPTDKDAEVLQAIWNAASREPSTVLRMTQKQYSERTGAHSSFETVTVSEHGTERRTGYRAGDFDRCSVFKVRKAPGSSSSWYAADRVVILTDKPQKPLPFAEMDAARAKQPTIETMTPKLPAIQEALRRAWLTDENKPLLSDAQYVGWVNIQSMSQMSWTDDGKQAMDKYEAAETVNA